MRVSVPPLPPSEGEYGVGEVEREVVYTVSRE